jgi:hypothetical protein
MTIQPAVVGAGGGDGTVVVVLVAALVVGATSVDGRSLPLVDDPASLATTRPPDAVVAAREHEALSRASSDTIATRARWGERPDRR